MPNSSIGDRIAAIRGSEPRASFAKALDINPSTLRSYEGGQALPNSDLLAKICVDYAINSHWLLTGTGEMRQSQEHQAASQLCVACSEPLPPEGFSLVPLVTARLSAGCGCDLTSAKVEKLYSFRLDFLQRKGNPKDMVLMRVSGRSMEPEIWDGDIALLDTAKKSIAHEKILAVRYEDDIYIKRIEKMPNGVTLRSVNPEYAPAFVELNECTTDNFEVLGRVIWIGREYR